MSDSLIETHVSSSVDIVEYSQQVLARHSRSFRLASRFLPGARRDDAALLYAVCRQIDDLADEAEDDESAAARLDEFRDELIQRRSPGPLVAAFGEMADRRDLDVSYALELIEGVKSDLGRVRLQSDKQLLRYCYRVAGTVGLMMCAVLGVEDRRGLPHAIDLGVAMQLTNICRDVLEDARMGRVYLPAERLRQVGLTHQDILDEEACEQRLAQVVEGVLDLADRYYDSADRGMRYIPAPARLGIVVASRVYRAIGVHLRWGNTQVLDGRTVVAWWAKVGWVIVALAAWTSLSLPMRKPLEHQSELHRPLEGLPGAMP